MCPITETSQSVLKKLVEISPKKGCDIIFTLLMMHLAVHSWQTILHSDCLSHRLEQCSQPPGRGPVPGPGIN